MNCIAKNIVRLLLTTFIMNYGLIYQTLGKENDNTLKIGPGHYSTTALPGTGGNVGIAGHRTTYGAPFGNLDESIFTADPFLFIFTPRFFNKFIIVLISSSSGIFFIKHSSNFVDFSNLNIGFNSKFISNIIWN